MSWTSNRRALVVSILALTLVAGVAIGVAADRLLTPRLTLRTEFDLSGVFDRLELTSVQRTQAELIVSRSAPRSEAIMIETAERLRSVADSIDTELRAILTAEQRLRLDSLRREPTILLKRRQVTPGGTRVDTVYKSPRP